MKPLVSILIPAYNSQRWIAATLDSALGQSWPNKEVIVVDDGSIDDTVEVVRSYESRGVRVLHQKNAGAAAARNLALANARGDYIQYLDADDLLSAEKIEAQVELLEACAPGMLTICPVTYFKDGSGPEQGLERSGWPFVSTDVPRQWLLDLWGANPRFGLVPLGSYLVSRGLADKAGPWDASVRSPMDDGEYFARVVLASIGIRPSSGRYFYRKFPNAGSYSSTRRPELFWGRLHSIDSVARMLLAGGDDAVTRPAMANCYLELAFISYPQYPDVTEKALERLREMGGTNRVPSFGTWRGNVLKRLIGWKATKRLNVSYHRCRSAAKDGVMTSIARLVQQGKVR